MSIPKSPLMTILRKRWKNMFKKIIILGLLVIFGLLFIIFLTNFIDVFGQGQFETDLESFTIESRTLPIIPFVRCITSILFCLFIYNFLKIMYLGDETNHESCPYLGRSFCHRRSIIDLNRR